MSGFWNAFVWVLTLGTLVGCMWLLQAMTTQRKDSSAKEDTTGHVWDGDLAEFNNPLPRWRHGIDDPNFYFLSTKSRDGTYAENMHKGECQ